MSKHMSKKEKEKREKIVKGMKKGDGKEFEKRYPGRGKEVMYATATKRAMDEGVIDYYKNILLREIFYIFPSERKQFPILQKDSTQEEEPLEPPDPLGPGLFPSKTKRRLYDRLLNRPKTDSVRTIHDRVRM